MSISARGPSSAAKADPASLLSQRENRQIPLISLKIDPTLSQHFRHTLIPTLPAPPHLEGTESLEQFKNKLT